MGSRQRRLTSSGLLRFECEDMLQIQALNRRLASLTIADMSSDLALQRVLLLYGRGDYREAAGFIRRLSYSTFRQVVEGLPMEEFVEAMPQSLPILEAFYSKLFIGSESGPSGVVKLANGINVSKYSPETVVWQIVKFFANQDVSKDGGQPLVASTKASPARWEMCGPWASSCKRLLSLLLAAEPKIKHLILERRKSLTKAIEGLGQHGLIGTSDESLLHLHDALRDQFEVTCRAYQDALSKLEQLCVSQSSSAPSSGSSSSSSGGQLNSLISNFNGKLQLIASKSVNGNHGSGNGNQSSASQSLLKSPPVAQSHQRQLSLRVNEIQERLIRNKSLLNAIEPTLESHSLEVLIGILQRRIELDKEVLFQFTQLKKDETNPSPSQSSSSSVPSSTSSSKSSSSHPSVAPILMKFQRGCQQVN